MWSRSTIAEVKLRWDVERLLKSRWLQVSEGILWVAFMGGKKLRADFNYVRLSFLNKVKYGCECQPFFLNHISSHWYWIKLAWYIFELEHLHKRGTWLYDVNVGLVLYEVRSMSLPGRTLFFIRIGILKFQKAIWEWDIEMDMKTKEYYYVFNEAFGT